MKKVFQQIFGSALFLIAAATQLQAQATLSVQGTIVQNTFTGGAAAIDNGQYDITFKLYTTDAGGTAIWSETQTIAITGGVYSALLGAVNPLNVPFDQAYYLGLTLPGGPEHTPRARLTSSPYALSLIGQDNKFPSTGLVKMESVATGQAITTATAYTVAADDHVIFLDHTANQNVTLPAATAANAGRHLMLVNKAAVAKTLTSSNYVDIAGATATSVPAKGVIELQSDGSVWRQTGGYVTPAATAAKAYVYCKGAVTTIPDNTWTTLNWTEVSDNTNSFSTSTFTAPRTGIYNVSGTVWSNGANTYGFRHYVDCYGTCAMGVATARLGNASIQAQSYGVVNFGGNISMNAGETLFLKIYQLSGVPYTTAGNSESTLTISEL